MVSVFGAVFWFSQFSVEPAPATWLPLIDLVLGVAAIVLTTRRRRRPFLVAVLTVAATTLSGMAVPAAVLALVSLVTTRRWGPIAIVVAIGIGAVHVNDVLWPDVEQGLPWWSLTLAGAIAWGIVVGVGLYVATRRDLARARREQAAAAEREQQGRLDQARLSERTRIAREMHDVLAHRISLLALHAGAMTYRDDLSSAELRQAAQVVQDNARQALTDLRDVLGVLRDPSALAQPGREPEPPQPTLAQLPVLLAETRDVGSPVDLVDERERPDLLPPTVGRTAYRIVQEGLTNARKHAPGVSVHLRLAGAPGGRLEIELSNAVPVLVPGGPGPVAGLPSAGVGLVGLAERTGLAGGRLSHGITSEGRYRVHVELPWAELPRADDASDLR